MKRLLLATITLATLSIYSAGCDLTSGSSNQRLGSDSNGDSIACATDADCPTGFECEVEAEHGTTTSLCKPHDEAEAEGADDNAPGSDDNAGSTGTGTAGTACATSADCGAGLECEVEVEHGVTTATCKAHGGAAADDTTGATGATDDSPSADDATGPSADDATGSSADDATGTGAGAIGAACATDADCSAGLECEVEIEHGVTTATCQEHKSGKI